jgi:transcriptional regulator with XRE-family HTH domain
MKRYTTNEILFKLFIEQNCTQIEFAHRVESDKNSIHDWFKHKNQLRYDKLEQMCERLGKELKIKIK